MSEPLTAVCSSIPIRSSDDTCITPSSSFSPCAAAAIARSSVDLPQPLVPSSAHRSFGMTFQLTSRISGLLPAQMSTSRQTMAAPPVSMAAMRGGGARAIVDTR